MVERKKQLEQGTRETIIRKYNAGKNPKKIAEELELNRKTVSSVISNFKKTGRTFAVKKRLPKNRKINNEGCELIHSAIMEDVSVTLKELKRKLYDDLRINASITTISKTIKEMNYSFKRVVLVPESRNTSELIELRFSYCSNYLLFDENNLIFVDEFGISCSTRVGYGRSLVGTSPRKEIRALRSKNFSVCAALCKTNLVAFEVNEIAYNSESFKGFINCLIGNLRRQGMCSGIIIMDNASIHKSIDLRNLVNENGFELVFLPAYSPQLNPIEEVFSKWKYIIKTMNVKNNEELNNAIQQSASLITRDDCESFYSHVRSFILKGIRREEF